MSITGSRNTLLGYGTALPDTLASNQIVIGTQNETTFIGGGLLGGLTISGSSLTLVGNTSLTVSGNAGISGQFLISGGQSQAPYWGPKFPQLIMDNYTLSQPISNLYTLSGPTANSPSEYKIFTLPPGFAGASTSLKIIDSVSGKVSGSIINLNAITPVTGVIMSPGDSGTYVSDGTNWFITQANESFTPY